MNRLQEQLILWQIRKRGKTQAFDAIYEHYYEAIGRYTRFRLPRREDAEDITNEAFLTCLQYIQDTAKPEVENVQAFLYHLARTSIAAYYRNQPRREVSVADPALFERASDQPRAEEQDYEERRAEQQQLLKQSLQDLNPEYREVILMRYTDGMSMEQIAETLKKSEGTVRVLLHRARASLKKRTKA